MACAVVRGLNYSLRLTSAQNVLEEGLSRVALLTDRPGFCPMATNASCTVHFVVFFFVFVFRYTCNYTKTKDANKFANVIIILLL